MVRRHVAVRRVGFARHCNTKSAIGRKFGRPFLVPVAALGPDAAGAFANLAPKIDAAHTLAAAHIAQIADAVMALDMVDSASTFADAMDAVAGASDAVSNTMDSVTTAVGDTVASEEPEGIQRMEGILSPISDRLESFVLGTQALFEKNNVPYPLGSSIIFTTFVVKALTYPFTKSQVEATLNIQNLAPQSDAIRDKYKDDPERMNVEINRLYEENQVSPLAGCVPILLTLPVVWGLYRAFNNASIDGSFDEPWFFIPSLAGPSPDRTLDWLLPLDADYNPPIGWHDASLYLIVPVLTVASQYLSMNILTPPKDPNADPDAKDPNDSLLLKALPLFIGYVSLTVPAGLTLYWLFNNVFTTATQVYLRQGGGAVAKIEKQEDFVMKIPLGCAVVDMTTMDTKPRDVSYDGPYVMYGTEEEDAVGSIAGSASGDSLALAAASGGGAFYTTEEERNEKAQKWSKLLSNRSTRARNPADREMASVAELEEVIREFENGGMSEEAAQVRQSLEALLEKGGDTYREKLAKEGEELKKEEEARAMREAVGAAEDSLGGLPSMEELENAVIEMEE